MKSKNCIFFNFGEDYSQTTEKISKKMCLLSMAQQGKLIDIQFQKQLDIHQAILNKLGLSYRIIELAPRQMEPSAYRAIAIELKCPMSEVGTWIPYTTINHKRDHVSSK